MKQFKVTNGWYTTSDNYYLYNLCMTPVPSVGQSLRGMDWKPVELNNLIGTFLIIHWICAILIGDLALKWKVQMRASAISWKQ